MKKLLIVLLASLMYFNTVTCVNVNAQAFGGSREELTVNNNTYYLEEDDLNEDDDIPDTLNDEDLEDKEYSSDPVLDDVLDEEDIMPLEENGEDGDDDDDSGVPSYIIKEEDNNLWNFNAYYIDEEGPYHAHKTGDKFNLIYQIEFHTDTLIPQYALRITVPADLITTDEHGNSVLLKDRNNDPIRFNEIAVPEAKNPVYKELDEDHRILESIESIPTKNIGFNYYIERNESDGKDYIVFFNYRELAVGTSAAIQVLYKNLVMMDMIDESTWTQPFTIDGYFPSKDDEYTFIHQIATNEPLTGDIDSHNTLTAATKIPYGDETKSYTPELYTKRQVDAYISWKDQANYDDYVVDNFDKDHSSYNQYRYAVWETSVKVTDANQPYYIDIKENLPAGAKVVGISSGNNTQPIGVTKVTDLYNPDNLSDLPYDVYRIWDNNSLREKGTAEGVPGTYQKEKNITLTNVRIVVAYPASYIYRNGACTLNSGNDCDVTNDLEVIVTPVDGKDPSQSKTVSTKFRYKDYIYGYGGPSWGTSKSSAGTYNGWSNAYASRSKEGKDLGGIPFTYSASAQQYYLTHITNNKDGVPGQAIKDAYIRVTAVDDLIYISNKKGGMDLSKQGEAGEEGVTYTLLEKGDYYYNYVDVIIDNYGYDVYEDTTSRDDATYINNSTKIYAMFEDTAEEKWELVKEYPTSQDYTQKYVFTDSDLSRHPYRVMAIHESNGYTQSVRINVNVSLKGTSDTVKKYICDTSGESNNTANSVTLQNNGGVIIQSVVNGAVTSQITTNEHKESDVYPNRMLPPVNNEKAPDGPRPYVSDDATRLKLYLEDNNQTNNVQPLRYREFRNGGWSPFTQGYAYLNNANPMARTYKNATVLNDTVNARINVSYSLIAYNGYEIYDESVISYMKSITKAEDDFKGNKEMVFFDLLPVGVEFDPSVPIIAGRLTSAEEKQIFKYTNAWDKKDVSVSVDPEKDVVTNFNGTGRTLVIFHVKYDGVDSTVFTRSRDINGTIRNLWIEGYGVNYGAYYTWENIGLVENENSYNVFAYTTDNTTDHTDLIGKGVGDSLSGIETYVYNINVDDKGNKSVSGLSDPVYSDLVAASKRGSTDIWTDSKFKEIVFGKGNVTDIYAKSSQAEIIKGVRADSDSFGAFDYQAEVKLGEPYSYEITIKTSGSDLEQIVVYDHLENVIDEEVTIKVGNEYRTVSYAEVVNDPATASKLSAKFNINPVLDDEGNPVKDTDGKNIYNSWYGTFNGVNKQSLILQGIAPVIYYSTSRNAIIPELSTRTTDTADSVVTFDDLKVDADPGSKESLDLAMSKGEWVREDVFTKYYHLENSDPAAALVTDLSKVKSYAVDMRKTTKGDEFKLKKMSSVSFRSSMISPVEMQTLTEGLTPDQISRKLSDKPAEFSYNNAAYSSSMGSLETTTLTSNPVRIRQTENDRLVVTKNVNKNVEVPENFKGQKFTFTLSYRLNPTDKYMPFANKYYELWEYNTVSKSWVKLTNTIHATDVDGKFQLKDNQRAEFMISEQTDYQIIENDSPYWQQKVSKPDDSSLDNNPEIVNPGTKQQYKKYYYDFENTFRPFMYITKKVSDYGTLDISELSFDFTLYVKDDKGNYKPAAEKEYWKVTRAYSDATTPEKTDPKSYYTDKDGHFTIGANETVCMFAGLKGDEYKVVENLPENSDWVLLNSSDSVEGKLEVMNNIVEFKNRYRLRDLYITKSLTHFYKDTLNDAFTFKVVENDGSENGKPLNGNSYFILNSDKEKILLEDGRPDPKYTGTLTADGTFTASIGIGNKTVLIEGLEYSKSYTVSELTAEDGTALVTKPDGSTSASEWRPLSTSSDVTMPIYSMSKDVSFTNDYLLRPLKITKTVVSQTPADPSIEYTMRAYIGKDVETASGKETQYELLTNTPFISSDSSRKAPATEDDSTAENVLTTDSNGEFTIKGSETITFEYLARVGTKFKVEEKYNGGFYQIYPAPAKDVDGKIIRPEVGEYQTPLLGSIAMEGANAMIINGEDGIILVGKEYVADTTDLLANQYLEKVKADPQSEAVTLTLKIKPKEGTLYTWPKADPDSSDQTHRTVTAFVTTTSGTHVEEIPLEVGKSFTINPWVQLLVTGLGNEDTFILSETEADSSKMYKASDKITGSTGFIDIEAIEDTINGTALSNPIATIQNKITSHAVKSSVMKYMKPASDPVVEGAEIIFRVEKYNSGLWAPASDIKYVVTEYDSTIDEQYMTSPLTEEDLYFVTSSVSKTDSSGKISYIKNTKGGKSLYPRINFIEDVVYTQAPLNSEGKPQWSDGDLRVVELTNESGISWGQWYSNSQVVTSGRPDSMISNSNRTVQMDLRKKLAEDEVDDGRSYTFIVSQVLSMTGDKPDKSIAGAGLPYIVFDEEGNVVETRTTNANGEATIKANETARFDFADGTNWTFSEVQDSVYKLDRDVEVDDGAYSRKLESNLAFVGVTAPKIPVLLTAVPNTYKAITADGVLVNTYTVTVYYSDQTSTVLTTGYNKTETKNPDNSWDVHFDYTENDVTVTADVHLLSNVDNVWTSQGNVGLLEFIAPEDGLYFLEGWGAQGGSVTAPDGTVLDGGKGGYSYGYVHLTKNQKVYVAVGGQGSTLIKNNEELDKNKDTVKSEHIDGLTRVSGGFNGGGSAGLIWTSNDPQQSPSEQFGSGGGATSFQLSKIDDGQLKRYVDNQDDVLLVAGGGGGSAYYNAANNTYKRAGRGGSGGGLEGGKIHRYSGSGIGTNRWVSEENQQPAGQNSVSTSIGIEIDKYSQEGFGSGANGATKGTDAREYRIGQGAGGGGGWYGGRGIDYNESGYYCYTGFGAGGGSGHVNNNTVSNGATIGGDSWSGYVDDGDGSDKGNLGNGFARITLVESNSVRFNYNGKVQEFTANRSGYYKLEAWGAQGGAAGLNNPNHQGGKGAYASGMVYLNAGQTIYVYVGGQGEDGNEGERYAPGGWNGGGSGSWAYKTGSGTKDINGGGGGGATDFRLSRDESDTVWDNNSSLLSRILVAGAGSGGRSYATSTGPATSFGGGKTTGLQDDQTNPLNAGGGTQNESGGRAGGAAETGHSNPEDWVRNGKGTKGTLGKGGNSCLYHGSGGGGGYYGGGGGGWIAGTVVSGAGGSSFVSGYDICATVEDIALINGTMIAGNETMPLPGGGTGTGNTGNGAAKVTYIGELSTTIEYSGHVEEYTAPVAGYYKLEAWGAQGGKAINPFTQEEYEGGKGGYSCGFVYLENNQIIYVSVGGEGNSVSSANDGECLGGWNGGGTANTVPTRTYYRPASGGGATSIQLTKVGQGQLKEYVNEKDNVLLVAGGGGGSYYVAENDGSDILFASGASGGGLSGEKGIAGFDKSQNQGGAQTGSDIYFGKGSDSDNDYWDGAGGGGWYGGQPSGWFCVSGAGGSGHINENKIINGLTIGGGTWTNYVHDGDNSINGNEGDGKAKITFIGEPSYTLHTGLRTSKGGYIDTGYVANENTRISVTYKYDKNTKGFVYGSRGGVKDFMLGDASGNDSEHFIYWYPGCTGENRWIKSEPIETGVKYKFTTAQDNLSASLEGNGDPVVIPNNSTSRAISGNTIYLFWMNKDSEKWLMDGVIYEFKVYENGNLVRNYVPVEEENSGAYGMLDTVNNVFYPGLGGQNHFSFEN